MTDPKEDDECVKGDENGAETGGDLDRSTPSGPIRICVCMGSSCFARGNGKNTRMLKEYLRRTELGESVELVGLLCEGKCSAGPNLQIDGHTYRGVAPSAIETILDHHFARDRGEKSS